MPRALFILTYLLAFASSFAQTSKNANKKLVGRPINVSDQNQIAPCLTLDGKELIYLSDQSQDDQMLLRFTQKDSNGQWRNPQDLKVFNATSDRNYIGGFQLSGDGKTLFYSVPKYGGIGGYDIWFSEKENGQWQTAKNIGKPINSRGHEGSPSLSPDGQSLYFMRCQKMSRTEAENCEIFVSQKQGRKWTAPEKLPDFINMGGAKHPKIQVDGKMLVFAREGETENLYYSRRNGPAWSKPVAMDFLNSKSSHEAFFATDAASKVAWVSTVFRGKYQLVQVQIPEEHLVEPVHYVEGTVKFPEDTPGFRGSIMVYESDSKKLVKQEEIQSGQRFELVLSGDIDHDFSIIDHKMRKPYVEKSLAAINDGVSRRNTINHDFGESTEILLENILWNRDSTDLSIKSEIALLRLARYLRKNKAMAWQLEWSHLREVNQFEESNLDHEEHWPEMWEVDVEDTDEKASDEEDKDEANYDLEIISDSLSTSKSLMNVLVERLENLSISAPEHSREVPTNRDSERMLILKVGENASNFFRFEQ